MKAECPICPHRCNLDESQIGTCGARKNSGGRISCENYGKTASIALDPIEKKPLRMFHPGTFILSTGSYGCNLHCPFCQNHRISMPDEALDVSDIPPEALIAKAVSLTSHGNIGVAYTYNEPLIGYEYVMDCSKLAREHRLKNVLVTNGYINEEPLTELLPYIDAMNIDLKSFRDDFYKRLGGSLETVKRTIELSAADVHIEVTTLIIPGENDSASEIEALSKWLSTVDKDIPLHLTRFYPRYKYADRSPTPVDTIDSLAETARHYLRYVFNGRG